MANMERQSVAREQIDIDGLRAWIGSKERIADVVTPQLAVRFAATLGLPMDEPATGDLAPAMIHYCLAPAAVSMSDLGPDGHPARGGFLPPVPLPRRMWAGGGITFHAPFRVGDIVVRTTEIADVVLKEGRSGRLCFVTLQHAYEVDGRRMLDERQDVVYRDLDTAAPSPAAKSQPAPAGEQTRTIDTPATLLFRYSALTFNGHRIHYDRAYTTKEEGYPGLVVHGPLQATCLVHFAAAVRRAAPRTFEFRAMSPVFDGEGLVLNAAAEGAALRMWSNRPGGPVAMSGTATW